MNDDGAFAERSEVNNPEPVDVRSLVKEGHIEKPPVDGRMSYCDETNNFRRFRLDPEKPSGYNVDRALTQLHERHGAQALSQDRAPAPRLLEALLEAGGERRPRWALGRLLSAGARQVHDADLRGLRHASEVRKRHDP